MLAPRLSSREALPFMCKEASAQMSQPQPPIQRQASIAESNQVSAREEALVEALQASQAANEALEAVIKMQVEAMEKVLLENKKLWQQAQAAQSLKVCTQPLSISTSEASTEILPDESKSFSSAVALDAAVQTLSERTSVPKHIAPAVHEPQASPRIQPPVVPPTPMLANQTQIPGQLSSPRMTEPQLGSPLPENVDGLAHMMDQQKIGQASPYVAEAFRLGWLAGVKSNSLAANRSPSSTRSDDSHPSDPGSYVMCSSKSESSGSERGSESPPGPSDKIPALPKMMAPPPPPILSSPPPDAMLHLEQLG